MPLRQADGQVGAEGVLIVQRDEVQLVEPVDAAVQARHVLMPARGGLAVAGDAHGREDGVPQVLHGFFLGAVWEDAPCPTRDGDRRDAPREAPAHLQAVEVGERLAARALGTDKASGVDALEILRIRRGDGEVGRALAGVVVEKVPLPVGDLVKDGVVGVEIALARQKVVLPAHDHLAAASGVGLRDAQAREVRAVDGAGDDECLAGLDVHAQFNEQLCVFAQFFFHENSPFADCHMGVLYPVLAEK